MQNEQALNRGDMPTKAARPRSHMNATLITTAVVLSLTVFQPCTSLAVYAGSRPQLPPVDESSKDPSFKNFRERSFVAIRNKDVNFIRAHTDDKIEFSFGIGGGKPAFLKEWGLNKAPRSSKFWDTMKQMLELGGVFDDEEKTSFTAPYVFALFPEKYDPYTFGVVTEKDAALHSRPETGSQVVAKLEYDIVELIDFYNDKRKADGWLKIRLPNGTEGYLQEHSVRRSIDYRVNFKKSPKDGVWRMTYFIAGD